MVINSLGYLSILVGFVLIIRDVFARNPKLGLIVGLIGVSILGLGCSSLFINHALAFPPYQIRIGLLFLLALSISTFIPQLADGWKSIPTSRLMLWHVVRAPIGMCFVLGGISGQLAPDFAKHAGWGDVLAGILALIIITMPSLNKRWIIATWNLIGVMDLALAIGTAVGTLDSSPFKIFPHGDLLMPLMTHPFVWVPMLTVPLLLFSHILIFGRLLNRDQSSHIGA